MMTIQESVKLFLREVFNAFDEKYEDVHNELRATKVTEIMYRDVKIENKNGALISTPGPSILEHIAEHEKLFGIPKYNFYYFEWDKKVFNRQKEILIKHYGNELYIPVHLIEGDIMRGIEDLKYRKGLKISMIDFDGTSSRFLTTSIVKDFLKYADCSFLAAQTRGKGKEELDIDKILHPSPALPVSIQKEQKPNYLQWLDSLYAQGIPFSATVWPNNTSLTPHAGAPMLGLTLGKHIKKSSCWYLKKDPHGPGLVIYEYDLDKKIMGTKARQA